MQAKPFAWDVVPSLAFECQESAAVVDSSQWLVGFSLVRRASWSFFSTYTNPNHFFYIYHPAFLTSIHPFDRKNTPSQASLQLPAVWICSSLRPFGCAVGLGWVNPLGKVYLRWGIHGVISVNPWLINPNGCLWLGEIAVAKYYIVWGSPQLTNRGLLIMGWHYSENIGGLID